MAQMVTIKNRDKKKELRIPFNSEVTVVGPGESAILEREAACAQFGVWWAVEGGRPIDRKDEVNRIRGLYGCLPGAPQEEGSASWEEVKPKVEIYEKDGTKVSTVIDDPHGENIPVTERPDEQHLRETVGKMQAQLEAVEAQLADAENKVSAQDLPAKDSPDTAPRRKRKEAEVEAAR